MLIISSTISTISYLDSYASGQKATLGFVGIILVVGLSGWAHFRIEWMQLRKGATVMSENDIKFYNIDPKEHDAEFKARKRKIFVFEFVMLLCLAVALLSGLPTLL